MHFEIRDQNNKPLNPLKNIYAIEDTLRPIAKSIAFIPLDNSCWINGIQDYSIFELQKLNEYKYVIQDTISVLGNFGLAIEAEDKMNTQPFNYNIYEIELLIDNKLMYKIKFDEYNMKNDHLIYNEIDYGLLTSLSKNFHRLYINNNKSLEFIDSHSISGLNINKNYHYLNINISDINDNKIQIQGIIKGDIILPPEFNLNNNIVFSEKGFENIELNYTTRYNDSRLIPASFTQIDSQYISIDIPEKPYDVLEYYLKDNDVIAIYRNTKPRVQHVSSNIKLIRHDISQDIKGLEHVDIIIHAAAHTHLITHSTAFDYIQSNIMGTLSLANYAKVIRPRLFIYLSTLSAYGEILADEINEDTPLNKPEMYGLSKS